MLVYFFILFGALLRVLPHEANFAPLGAIALFSGAYLKRSHAVIATLSAMVISDFFIGFDSITSRLFVYGALLIAVALGRWIGQDKAFTRVLAGSMLGSVVFFLITNLVFVHPEPLYPITFAGQMQSYINGIPFFRNTLLSDLFYVSLFFGIYELVVSHYPSLRKANDNPSARTN